MLEEFQTMFRLGMLHIADGTDHILFLMTLILTAVDRTASLKEMGFGLLKLVTAFTVGHSLSLLAGVYQWVHLPSQPIEVAIALTILLSSVHLLKPIWRGWEFYVVLFFGLIHGLAFAGLMAEIETSTALLFVEVLGFNLGIEFFQLLVLLLFVPLLFFILKGPWYQRFRSISAYACLAAGCLWLFERLGLEIMWFSAFRWEPVYWLFLIVVILILAVLSCTFRDRTRSRV
jgi:hypothetical protein